MWFFFTDKLTGVLPILRPGVQRVPLPKVAAHVTGVGSFAEPPTADGEDPEMKYPVHRVRVCYVWNEVLESIIYILNAGLLVKHHHNAPAPATTVVLHP